MIVEITCPTCNGNGKVDNPIYPRPEEWNVHKGTKKYWDRWSHGSVDSGEGFSRYLKIQSIGKNSNDSYFVNLDHGSWPIMTLEDMTTRVKLINRQTGEMEIFEP